MLLTNETLLLYPVEFFSINNQQMSCIVNMKTWLYAHFLVTLMIHALFVHIYIVLAFLYLVTFLFYPRSRSFILAIHQNIQLYSYAHQGKFFYGIMLLIREMLLVFVYVLFAFLYKWFGLAYNGS
jgi:hypothetical protein